tara:strand:+ start:4651 stop:5088 length:438 start_codon:yes stop_codon:yes gene_type:complete
MRFFLLLPFLLGVYSPVFSDEYHDKESSGVQIKTLLKSSKQRNGKLLPRYPKSKPEITVLKITIPPKTVLPPHTHPIINSGVILEGILELTDKDGTKQIFKKDDAFNEVVNIIHTGKVIGENPVVVVVFYAGTKKLPLTVLTKNN